MKAYYSAKELYQLGVLNGASERTIKRTASKENWSFRDREGRGGGVEYAVDSFCQEIQAEIKAKLLQQMADSVELPAQIVGNAPLTHATAKNPPQPPFKKGGSEIRAVNANPTLLADWQRNCGTARLAIVRHVLEVAELIGKTKAVEKMVSDSKDGKLTATLADTLRRANAKAGAKAGAKTENGGNAKVSRATLFNWLKIAEEATENDSLVALLAPKSREIVVHSWSALLLKLWQQPTKPTLSEVMRQLAQALNGENVPTRSQAEYFLKQRVGNVELQRGRMGSREIKNILPFIRRDTSMLFPTDIYTADGHTFDAEVAHPLSGKPFRPEITVIIDVASRKVVGYSVDLAESGLAVLSAITMAVCVNGVMAIFYVDNGTGYKNALMSAEGVGLMDRLGTEIKHSLPYNSQAKGIIERSHQTIWVRLAKRLPTYIGKDMDKQRQQAVFKKTRQEIKEFGQSNTLVSWDEFLKLCAEAVNEYNNQPHSSLPRRVNKLTGRRGNMTPQEYWDLKVAEMPQHGLSLVTVSEAEALDLFRPRTEATVERCEIKIFNHIYFSKDLTEYHGERLQVGYDVHDPMQIWVYDWDGRLLAVAKLHANRQAYYPQSVIEQTRQKRLQGQLKRNQNKGKEILETMSPSRVLQHIDTMRLPQAEIDLAQANWAKVLEGEAVEIVVDKVGYAKTANPTYEPATTLDTVIDNDNEKFERWLALDARKTAGEMLDSNDFDFWDLFRDTKLWRNKMATYKGGNTTPTGVDAMGNNDGWQSDVIRFDGFNKGFIN
ncbi:MULTISPECIES: Mu transposase C-terminal domain-containing protein [unclassified Moraxella]|uniref:Mu transposase C-terminal domain-containing protein n=1 Tax=unclassified Moraxella TaxID=2685852 RepID=UPI003AF91C53